MEMFFIVVVNVSGIKIDMRKHRKKLRRLGNQFKPFNDVFGCDLRPESMQDSYNATLLRFPLRTKAQVKKHIKPLVPRLWKKGEIRSSQS